jgi:hypothetical protein
MSKPCCGHHVSGSFGALAKNHTSIAAGGFTCGYADAPQTCSGPTVFRDVVEDAPSELKILCIDSSSPLICEHLWCDGDLAATGASGGLGNDWM